MVMGFNTRHELIVAHADELKCLSHERLHRAVVGWHGKQSTRETLQRNLPPPPTHTHTPASNRNNCCAFVGEHTSDTECSDGG
jgi:hypothetical protein